MATIKTTNYQKFQTRNPVVRWMFGGFFRKLASMVGECGAESVLDAGCGEGETLDRLGNVLPKHVEGFDLNEQSVVFARERLGGVNLSVRDIYRTGYPGNAFDLVICCEVLEHLDKPDAALRELLRVTRHDLILTVPHEPWFQVGSFLRGKYVATWGNHPEHVNHWNPGTFRAFIEPIASVVRIDTAFPWVLAHCRKPR